MNQINQQKFYGLDHLRALAIALVFLFHYSILSAGQPSWLPGLIKFGWTGVDLFFVLSGFLIASQVFAQLKQGQVFLFRQFFLKRFFRIVPAFLVTVALYFIFPFFREKESLPPLWKFLTFTQNFGLNIKDYGSFSHAWSLCVEEHFYLLLPLTLLLLQNSKTFRKGYWLLIVLFLFGFAIRMYSYNVLYLPKMDDENSWLYWYKYIYYPSYNRLDGLLAGVSISAVYQFLPGFWARLSRYGTQLTLLGLALLTAAYFLCEDQTSFASSVFGFPLIALAYGCMVIGAISPQCFLYKWKSNLTTQIATLSYAVYLTHKGIIHITRQLLSTFNINNNLMLLTCIITCFCFAILLHQIIEKPFMKLRGRVIEATK